MNLAIRIQIILSIHWIMLKVFILSEKVEEAGVE